MLNHSPPQGRIERLQRLGGHEGEVHVKRARVLQRKMPLQFGKTAIIGRVAYFHGIVSAVAEFRTQPHTAPGHARRFGRYPGRCPADHRRNCSAPAALRWRRGRRRPRAGSRGGHSIETGEFSALPGRSDRALLLLRPRAQEPVPTGSVVHGHGPWPVREHPVCRTTFRALLCRH